MSIVLTSPAAPTHIAGRIAPAPALHGLLLSAALTPLSLFILGYHPYAEDGGLYLAGVKYLLNPSLFPSQRAFVTAPLNYSLFAPFLAGVVRHSRLPFGAVVFSLFVLSLWATIFAGWSLSRRCFRHRAEQSGATLLVSLWLGLPVAGTSLMLIDPYLTARSFSTPCVLFALSFALGALAAHRKGEKSRRRNQILLSLGFLCIASIFHPLMAGYGAVFILSLAWLNASPLSSLTARALLLLLGALLLAGSTQLLAPSVPAGFLRVAQTRSYWYLGQWQWFEVLGLLAPMAILVPASRSRSLAEARPLLTTAVVVGGVALLVALLFARAGLSPSGVAHLQPLRVFQLIYIALLLTLGALLGGLVLRRRAWAWVLATVVLAAPVLVSSWSVFAHSRHIEIYGNGLSASPNSWVRAFEWIRLNTPPDALFALDADYISQPGEDAQSFRAIAERSALPDYSKDGGETAVNPQLSPAWVAGADAQRNLSSATDGERFATLKPLGVSWLVLRSDAQTGNPCSYNNGTVKVCPLP